MKEELLIAGAAELDRSGFLPLPGEKAEDFFARFKVSEEAFAEFENALKKEGKVSVFGECEVTAENRIPPEIVAEAAERTRNLYGFENRRVPGFFLSTAVGALWGGCMIGDPDNGFAVMLLRSEFRNRSKWYLYERGELLAHELCHAMRQSLCDVHLEEYFAYQTGKSFLRRNFGNCFIRERDAWLFILPTFLLLGATIVRELGVAALPLLPFWCLAGIYPCFLLLRNFFSIRLVRRAEQKLRLFKIPLPGAILFRSTLDEIKAIGKLKNQEEFNAFVETMSQTELRWAIIKLRFSDQEKMKNETC